MSKITFNAQNSPQEPSRSMVAIREGGCMGGWGGRRGTSTQEECDPFVGSCLETMEQAIQSKRGGSDVKNGLFAVNQLLGYLVGKGYDVHLTNDLLAQMENNPQAALAAVAEQTRSITLGGSMTADNSGNVGGTISISKTW